MNQRDFIYWLNGYLELQAAKYCHSSGPVDLSLTSDQVQSIRDHLALVMTKITPNHNPLIDGPLPQQPPTWPHNPFPYIDGPICSTPKQPETFC